MEEPPDEKVAEARAAAYALEKRGFRDVAFIDGGVQSRLDAGYSTDK